MRGRGLLERAFHPRSKWRRTTYTLDDLYLWACRFAIRFAHPWHSDCLYPYRTPDILGTTSRLVIGIITTSYESVPHSEFPFIACSTYSCHPIITGTKPIELPVTRSCYSFFLFLFYCPYDGWSDEIVLV